MDDKNFQKDQRMSVMKKRLLQVKCMMLMLVSIFLLSSCCTLFCIEKEVPALTIESSVPSADVYINGSYYGKTPVSYFSDKVDVKKITVKKEGYKTQSIDPRKLNGWAYMNFLPYPLYNWIWGYFLDRSQSKCWKYEKDVFYFKLERE